MISYRFLLRLALIAAVIFLIGCITIILDGLHDNLHHADLAVVLGNKVNRDWNTVPTTQGAPRSCRRPLPPRLLPKDSRQRSPRKGGYDEPRVMKQYLIAQGIPVDALFEDNEGFNTWDTARNTASFLHQRQLNSVLIISQYFHMPRCRLAFAKFGISPLYSSYAPLWSLRDFLSVPREVAGYFAYFFRDPKIR